MKISKTKFLAGVQCLKRLYLLVHAHELAAQPDGSNQAIIDQGREVGLLARQLFPGGVEVDGGSGGLEAAIRTTRELANNPDVPAIFEAAFEHNDVVVKTDILQRREENRWRLVEVKSTADLKDHHSEDLAIQSYVLSHSGLKLASVWLAHVNRSYVLNGTTVDPRQFFSFRNLTTRTQNLQPELKLRLREQFRILAVPKPPEVPTGPHCINPVVCEFFYHCNHPKPEDYIGYIPRLHASAIEQLEQMGIESIHEIPADFELSEFQRRACTAMQTGQPWFSADLKNEFESLKSPLYFMDFETVNPGWKRQEFNFELSYYLNCYYPLIFGGFDHLALIVNHCLGLGLGEKNVGATYKGFLDALQAKNAKLHGIFTDPKHVGFMKRVAALRHYASHRGSLAPAKIVDAPKQVPTDAELDAEIAAAGADIVYRFMPKGELRDSMVAIVRNNFKMAHYEKGKVIDGVVLIEIDGKKGFISPITDTSWNFQKFTSFMNEIFTELAKAI